MKIILYLLAVIGLFSLGVVLFFSLNAKHFNEKYDGGYVETQGIRSEYVSSNPSPIWQDEKHTCGYLSISAIYHAYGINPKDLNVRLRLGTDAKANSFDQSSLGTIHPDIYRVMYQDGFVLTDLSLSDQRYKAFILSHLYNRHLVLFLIKRPKSGNLHWVVGADPRDGSNEKILIIDSLEKDPYTVEAERFVNQHVVSALLVFRPAFPEEIDAMTLNAMGIASAARAMTRM